MQQLIHNIWYQGHFAKWLLMPFSWLFGAIAIIRRQLFALGLKQSEVLPVPVIVVGNITAGGSGKTPTVIYLIELLRQQGYKPGVISRGYGVTIDGVRAVTANASASEVGDEPAMIVARTKVPMVVGSKRVMAAKLLLEQYDVDVIISDDGLQHYALARDIEIALVDGQRRYGNQHLLPAGPLREGLWRLDSIDFIINNGGPLLSDDTLANVEPSKKQLNEVLMQLIPAPLRQVNPELTAHFDLSQPAVAMAGIGNPPRFFNSLNSLGYTINNTVEFADHQAFQPDELIQLSQNTPLIMTEKDAIKCRSFAQQHWWYLPVNAKMNPQFDQALLRRLSDITQSKQGNPHGVR